jgi:hypothetical protein
MSIDAIPGLNSITGPVGKSAGTVAVATQGATTGQPAGTPTSTAAPPPKPTEPFVLVPTEPLTPKVLAELIGRQLGLTGSPVPQ